MATLAAFGTPSVVAGPRCRPLFKNDRITPRNQQHLILQPDDGNAVIYRKGGGHIWSTGTNRKDRLKFGQDRTPCSSAPRGTRVVDNASADGHVAVSLGDSSVINSSVPSRILGPSTSALVDVRFGDLSPSAAGAQAEIDAFVDASAGPGT